jgi:hypothetical protein
MTSNHGTRGRRDKTGDVAAVIALCNAVTAAIGGVYIATGSEVVTLLTASSVVCTTLLLLRRRRG